MLQGGDIRQGVVPNDSFGTERQGLPVAPSGGSPASSRRRASVIGKPDLRVPRIASQALLLTKEITDEGVEVPDRRNARRQKELRLFLARDGA